MTALWLGVIIVACLGGVAAGVWLLVLAFREHLGWGFACCLIPFAAVAFAVKYWEEAKKPFLYSLTSSLLAVVGVLGYSVSAVNAELGDSSGLGTMMVEADRPLSAEFDAEPVYSPAPRSVEIEDASDQAEADDDAPAEPEPQEPSASPTPEAPPHIPSPKPRRREKGVVVPKSNLHTMVGELVQLTLSSGERMSVRVEAIESDAVRVRQRVGGGSVAFTISLDDITEIRTRKEP